MQRMSYPMTRYSSPSPLPRSAPVTDLTRYQDRERATRYARPARKPLCRLSDQTQTFSTTYSFLLSMEGFMQPLCPRSSAARLMPDVAQVSGPSSSVNSLYSSPREMSLLTTVADEHPECEVTGVDLSPIQPTAYVIDKRNIPNAMLTLQRVSLPTFLFT